MFLLSRHGRAGRQDRRGREAAAMVAMAVVAGLTIVMAVVFGSLTSVDGQFRDKRRDRGRLVGAHQAVQARRAGEPDDQQDRQKAA